MFGETNKNDAHCARKNVGDFMKLILIGLLALGSLCAFAGGKCTVEVGTSLFGASKVTEHNISDDINGALTTIKVAKYPELTIQVRENYDRMALIGVTSTKGNDFFVLGKERAYLSFEPIKNNGLDKIIVDCVLN